jgi:hypothetical protein
MKNAICLMLFLVLVGAAVAEKPRELRVYPASISLDGQTDRQHLVVQAIYKDDETRNVLRQAKVSISNADLLEQKGDVFWPKADGKGSITIRYEGVEKKIPFETRQAKVKRPVSFLLDVEPTFMRMGCNTGSCHGSARGQDGFMLSLFGYDPEGDYHRLTREIIGRRIDLAVPAKSLLLEKATGEVTHTGGECMTRDSEYYATLLEWIETGAKNDEANTAKVTGITFLPDQLVFKQASPPPAQQMVVMAHYDDGTVRDVTHLGVFLTNNERTVNIDERGDVTAGDPGSAHVFARFDKFTVGQEVIVLPNDDYQWNGTPESNYIDTHVFNKLKKLHILPSEICTDEQFVRRSFIDIIGLPPSPEEYQSFVQDTSPSKRESLVVQLLQRDEFADVWSMKWGELLQITEGRQQNNSTRPLKAVWNYYHFIADAVKRNVPVDEMVHALISGSGSNLHSPAANFYTSSDRITAQKMAENVAQQFLGTRIQCAQCHNHPFDRWTMDDYYGFTGFFEGISTKRGADEREVFVRYNTKLTESEHPVYKETVPAKFLGGEEPDVEGKDPRPILADWMTSRDNRMFARNVANRIWAHYFGRGVIDPIDDVRISNPPANSELLDALADKLVAYDFDAKRLIRDVLLSRTYQLSSTLNETNADDHTQFSHGYVRRLQAEVMLDTIHHATETTANITGYPKGMRATQLFQGGGKDAFLKTFGASERLSVCACEVNKEATLSQALEMINGTSVDRMMQQSKVIVDQISAKASVEDVIGSLYVRCLSRKPSGKELAMYKALLADVDANEPKLMRAAYEDVLWGILNSTEFGFNH